EPDELLLDVTWSSDGTRVAYLKSHRGRRDTSIETVDVTGHRTQLLSHPGILGFRWTSDGRLIYTQREVPLGERTYGLWQLRGDSGNESSANEATRLTKWAGEPPTSLSVSAEGRRIGFTKGHLQSEIFVGDVASDATLNNLRRLSQSDSSDRLGGWTSD